MRCFLQQLMPIVTQMIIVTHTHKLQIPHQQTERIKSNCILSTPNPWITSFPHTTVQQPHIHTTWSTSLWSPNYNVTLHRPQHYEPHSPPHHSTQNFYMRKPPPLPNQSTHDHLHFTETTLKKETKQMETTHSNLLWFFPISSNNKTRLNPTQALGACTICIHQWHPVESNVFRSMGQHSQVHPSWFNFLHLISKSEWNSPTQQ